MKKNPTENPIKITPQLDTFLKKLAELEVAELKQGISSEDYLDPGYSQNKEKFSKKIYEETKIFLDYHSAILSPEEKGHLLSSYIALWSRRKCSLPLNETSYSNLSPYKYTSMAPMMAGFNLQNACLTGIKRQDLFFLGVNLKGCYFSSNLLAYSIFVGCDLSEIKTQRTNLNQSKFFRCDLQTADLQGAVLCGGQFDECNLRKTHLTKEQQRLWQYNCLTDNSESQNVEEDSSGNEESKLEEDNRSKKTKFIGTAYCTVFNSVLKSPEKKLSQNNIATLELRL